MQAYDILDNPVMDVSFHMWRHCDISLNGIDTKLF